MADAFKQSLVVASENRMLSEAIENLKLIPTHDCMFTCTTPCHLQHDFDVTYLNKRCPIVRTSKYQTACPPRILVSSVTRESGSVSDSPFGSLTFDGLEVGTG